MSSRAASLTPATQAEVSTTTELERFFETLRARRLVPVEVTRECLVQRLVIENDTLIHRLTVQRERIDALQTIGILFDAIVLVAREGLFAQARPNLSSGQAAIALALRGNTIEAIHDPPDSAVLKGLLVADLLKLCELTNEEDFDPFLVLAGLMRFEVNVTPGETTN